MRDRRLILTGIGLGFLLLAATSTGHSQDWDARWKEVKGYDSMADLLKNGDGTWKEPKKAVISILRSLDDEIRTTSALYGVDARAIVAAILTENSLNVQADDAFQDWLVKKGILSTGQIAGKAMTIGLGQINVPAAREVEALAAQTEGRSKRSDKEIAQELLKPGSAIKYCAAILRHTQDVYKDNGFDISGNVPVLASLYNMGKPEQRVATTKAAGRQPKVNYFGLFVEHSMNTIESVAPKPAPKPVVLVEAKAPDEPNPAPKEEPKKPEEKKIKQVVASKAIALSISPATCSTEGSGKSSEYVKIATQSTYGFAGQIPAGSRLERVLPGLGCDLEPYTLVRAANGAIGWVSNKTLNASSREELLPESKCSVAGNLECQAKVFKDLDKKQLLAANVKQGQLEFRLAGPKAKVNWKKSDGYCLGSYGSPYGASGSPSGSVNEKVPASEVTELVKKFSEKKAKILDVINEARKKDGRNWAIDWDSSENPYKMVFEPMNGSDGLGFLKDCAATAEGGKPAFECIFDKAAVQKALEFEIKYPPSYSYLKTTLGGMYVSVAREANQAPEAAKDVSAETEKKRKEFKEYLKNCVGLAQDWPKSKAYLERVFKGLDEAQGSSQIFQYKNNFENLGRDCATMLSIFEPSPDSNNNSGSGISCNLTVNTATGQRSVYSYVDKSALKLMLATKEDRDEFLNDRLVGNIYDYMLSANNSSGGGYYGDNDEERCSYDPFKTAELIEGILKNKCVTAVHVPDPWLLKKLKKHGARVLYRPFGTDDRFMVDISQVKCGGGSK